MTKNRRFPFERSTQVVALEHVFTKEKQLYPMIRQYLSVSRHYNDLLSHDEESKHIQQTNVPYEDDHQLNQFIDYLKQRTDTSFIDSNNFLALRNHNIQRWKHIKYEWRKYYHEKNRKNEALYGSLIKSSNR